MVPVQDIESLSDVRVRAQEALEGMLHPLKIHKEAPDPPLECCNHLPGLRTGTGEPA